MTINEYEISPITLRWHRRSSGQWLLKADDGTIWAAVTRWRDGPPRYYKGKFVSVPELCGKALRARCAWWTTGATVARVKRHIESDLYACSHADFRIE
jgi:hypothetical protein